MPDDTIVTTSPRSAVSASAWEIGGAPGGTVLPVFGFVGGVVVGAGAVEVVAPVAEQPAEGRGAPVAVPVAATAVPLVAVPVVRAPVVDGPVEPVAVVDGVEPPAAVVGPALVPDEVDEHAASTAIDAADASARPTRRVARARAFLVVS